MIPRKSHLAPDRFFDSAHEALHSVPSHVEAVAVDLDGVLIQVDGDHSSPEMEKNVDRKIFQKFQRIKDRNKTCIITNRTRYDSFDKEKLENFFKTPVLDTETRKPWKSAYLEVLETLNTEPGKTVMIGDSPVMDIYGANRAGFKTFQVRQNRSRYNFPEKTVKKIEDLAQKLLTNL